MRILAVDDVNIKISAYREIAEELNLPADCLTCVSTAYEAKRELAKTQFDVLLLDLVLPERNGEPLLKECGSNLLKEVLYLSLYKVPTHIFAISEYEDALQDLQKETDKAFITLINYDVSSNSWRQRLKSYLEQISRARDTFDESHQIDVAILCALDKPELEEVLKLPFTWKVKNILGDSTDYYTGTYNGKSIMCAAAYEMGMPAAAILSTKVTLCFKPKCIIMTGIAAGTDRNKTSYGDIIVADPCFDYGSGKRIRENGESILLPDYRQVRLNAKANQIFRRLSSERAILDRIKCNCSYNKPAEALKIHIGAFASGSSVVEDPTAINDVKAHSRKLIGFDMEAYGVMLSGAIASCPQPLTMVIKSISDFGDTGKTDDYQQYAAYTSAQIVPYIIDMLAL